MAVLRVLYWRLEYQDIEPFSLLRKGRPSDVILETSNEEDVDLIVMGSQGMGGIIGFLGSTSRHVVESQPVLIKHSISST
jgi:nucleotide-binding universal stress UspA family protein